MQMIIWPKVDELCQCFVHYTFQFDRYVIIMSNAFDYLRMYYNKYKEKLVILQSIGIIVIKQGWSPTPADILVGKNPTRISAGVGDHLVSH